MKHRVQDLGVQEVEMRDLNLERKLLLVVILMAPTQLMGPRTSSSRKHQGLRECQSQGEPATGAVGIRLDLEVHLGGETDLGTHRMAA